MNKHLSYILPILLIAIVWFGSHEIFDKHKILLDAIFPIITIIAVTLHINVVRFITELNQKLQIKKQFGGYVSPVIVERLQKNPELIKLGGESRELSVVMTDMRNFTALGESYGDRVEEFTATMNEYMTAISRPILKNDGCLIKFIGDASLHVHGAPIDDEHHAKNAVKTALEMLKAVEEFNESLKAQGKPPVGMGAGIYTGETLIGNIGSKERFGYDVLGDTVSMAARLEGQSKPYGVKLVIGPNTAKLVKHDFFVLELDCIAVKGKSVGVKVYTVLDNSNRNGAWHTHQIHHARMMKYYRAQNFDEAIKSCNSLHGAFNGQMDKYYDMWIDRCEQMKEANLPEDWDFVYRATTK